MESWEDGFGLPEPEPIAEDEAIALLAAASEEISRRVDFTPALPTLEQAFLMDVVDGIFYGERNN